MYRRDVFLRQGGLDTGPGEDLEFTLRCAAWAISPLRAGRLGGDGRTGRRHKPFAPAGALGSRCAAVPLHNVRRAEASFIAMSACRTRFSGWTSFSSISFPRLAYRSIWFTSCCCTAPMPLCFLPRFISFCSGFRFSTWRLRSSCSIDRLASLVWEHADLSILPGRLHEVRPVLLLLLGNHVRRVSARRLRAAARSARTVRRTGLRGHYMNFTLNRLDPNVPDPVRAADARPDDLYASPMQHLCSVSSRSLSFILAGPRLSSAGPARFRRRDTWFHFPIPCKSAAWT